MLVCYLAPEPYSVAMLEAALIHKFQSPLIELKPYTFLFLFTQIVFVVRKIQPPLCQLLTDNCFLQGTYGCKNERGGGETCRWEVEALEQRLFMTYVVYTSFKHPPPVQICR